jgi:hypothetical protein
MLWRTSADVAQDSSRSLPKACHSAAFDSPTREAARCQIACRDLPRAAPISCQVRFCDRATFTASFSMAAKYFWNAEMARNTSIGSASGFCRSSSQLSHASLIDRLSNLNRDLSMILDKAGESGVTTALLPARWATVGSTPRTRTDGTNCLQWTDADRRWQLDP